MKRNSRYSLLTFKSRTQGALLGLLAVTLLLAGCASAPQQRQPAAVATAHPLATQAALRTLDNGGNAFDAAVTAAAVLGVVEPYSAGLGGGGFWLLRKRSGETVLIDAREIAPGESRRDMYLDANGDVLSGKPSLNGPRAAAIPGQPAALAYIGKHYAERPLSANLSDAVRLARTGFRVDARYRHLATFRKDMLKVYPASAETFLVAGDVPPEGELIRQPALARTLEILGRQGHDGFYQGDVADSLVQDVRAAGGIWTPRDLADYQVIERQPLTFRYGNAEVWTTPPPSAGGVALAQMFGMLEAAPLPTGADRVARIHHLIELMRRAYRDRARFLGDPGFVDIPLDRILSPDYLARKAASIDPLEATPSTSLGATPADPPGGRHTTHFSIVDGEGNMVAATLSINWPFGSAFTSPSTGVLLNDEMDDFSIRPGKPNTYGLVGHAENAIAPGKRPLSSMTPTIMRTPERTTVIGTPGGSRIPTMVFLGMLESLDGASAEQIVSAPRFHHQYLPDQIQYEPGALSSEQRFELEALGHELKEVGRRYGNMQVVVVDSANGKRSAAADPRGVGQAIVRPTQ
ncbi:gamma-glutamyltransferase [Marinobacteraceae bacterium S3BR75-40.1]